jgi:hypothetical protein
MPPVNASLRSRLTSCFCGKALPQISTRAALSVIIGFFFIVAYIASLGGDFPLNDDWAYGETTRNFLQTGRIYMPTVCAAGFAHIFWGALFAKIFGFSYVSLRYAVIVAGAIGVCLAYFTLVELGIHRRESLICALVYAVNPIMVNLYLGFMSDVPALTLSTGYFYFLLAGLRRRSLKHVFAALLLLILAITIRQSTVVLALSATAILFSRNWNLRLRLILTGAFLILGLGTFWGVDKWLMIRDATGQAIVDHYAVARTGHSTFVLGFLHYPLQQILKSIAAFGVVCCYIGLFCSPMILAVWLAIAFNTFGRKRPPRSRAFKTCVILGLAVTLLVCLVSAYYEVVVLHAQMPFCENILRITSVGAQGIMGIANPLLTARQKARLTGVSFALAALFLAQLAALLFLALGRVRRLLSGAGPIIKPLPLSRFSAPATFVVLSAAFATLGFLTVETVVRCTDRYYLIALLPAIMTLAYCGRLWKVSCSGLFGLVLVLALAWYSLAAGQDYICSNAARWQALNKLEAEGINSALIDGGAEYNVLRDVHVYASRYRGAPPRDSWRWWPIHGEDYIVSFSPVPEYEEKWKETYFSLLTMSEHPVYVLTHVKLNK